jgi:hypothetical protein
MRVTSLIQGQKAQRNLPQESVIVVIYVVQRQPAGIGRAQRELAKAFDVHLIPKRYLAQVLASPGATTDGIHLSADGAALMEATVEGLLGGRLIQ